MFHLKHEPGLSLTPTKKILKAKEYGAFVQAQEIIALAKEEAAAIKQKAQEDYEAEKKRGFKEGMLEGKEKISEHMVTSVATTVQQLESFEGEVIEIVMNAVKRIIGELDDTERISRVVKKALAVVRNQKKIILRVHPKDSERLQKQLDTILEDFPGIAFLDITPDSRMKEGDCMLETDIGSVDARIAVQLEAIKKSLINAVK